MTQTVSAAYQALIRVSGFKALFNTYSGGAPSRDGTRWYNGGAVDSEIVRDRRTWSDVTVTKGFQWETDPAVIRFVEQSINLPDEVVCSVTPTRPDGSIAYQARQLRGVITELTPPDWDANGGTTVPTWGLTIMVATAS